VREVSVSELRRLAGGELAERTDQALGNADWGVAIYRADRGGMKCVISFGGPRADIPTRFPPSHYSDLLLDAYVMPEPIKPTMRSPLMDWEQPPQISVPRGRSETLYPDVQIETRGSRHPRPQSDPSRYLIPGTDREPVRKMDIKWW
jgi:hypothetical protein